MKKDKEIVAEIANYDLKDDLEKKFPKIWKRLSKGLDLSRKDEPIGILLGGQPGAGKSFATMEIVNKFKDVIVINGDEFRSYHKHYDDFYHLYGKDASKHTAEFAGAMVGKIRDEAISRGLNIVIEGTFRTLETPLKELENFKKHGYKSEIIVCTCSKELSWESTLKRAEYLEEEGLQPRYVPKEHFDDVVNNLPDNVNSLYKTGLASRLQVFNREGMIFDSSINKSERPGDIIYNELHQEAKKNFISNEPVRNFV